MASEHKDEPLWDTDEAAAFLKVKRDTLYRWARAGSIPCAKIGGQYRFRPDTLREIADRGLPSEGAA